MPRRVWEAIEAKIRKVRVAETERQREEETRKKETRSKRKKEKEKTKEREKDESTKSSRRMGALGWERGGSETRSRSKEIGTRMLP